MQTPALFWWRLSLDMSRKDCVNRAHAAISSELRGGKVKKEKDTVSYVGNGLQALISCFSCGSNTTAVIIVTSNTGREALGILENLRTGMQTGVFE